MKKEGKGAISYIVLAAVLVALFVFTLNITINNSNITGNVVEVDEDITFAVVGDFGANSDPESDVANLIKSWNVNFVTTTGDNIYDSSNYDQSIGKSRL